MRIEQILRIASVEDSMIVEDGAVMLAKTVLYTNTGDTEDWGIALRVDVLEGEPPENLMIKLELVNQEEVE